MLKAIQRKKQSVPDSEEFQREEKNQLRSLVVNSMAESWWDELEGTRTSQLFSVYCPFFHLLLVI